MNQPEQIIDFSSWTGNWPFTRFRYRELQTLQNKLQTLNIVRSYVSPIEAILEQDPIRANRQLLHDLDDDFFSPVLIVDMSYANWAENIELAMQDGRVKMIKLLPNYHMYELNEQCLEPLVKLTQQHQLFISIQMRLEDQRGQHPLMVVDDVDIFKVINSISYFPKQTFIINNSYVSEMIQSIHSLSNMYFDISSFERIDTMQYLQQNFPLERLLFGSHSPFYFPEANVYKLKYSEASKDSINKVAYKNASQLLG